MDEKKKRSEMKTRKEATEHSEEQREIACENSRFSSLTQEGRLCPATEIPYWWCKS